MNPLVQVGLVAGAYFAARMIGAAVRKRRAVGPNAASTFAGLRQMALTRASTDVTAPPIAGVFSVLMELGMRGAVASVVGVVDGNASLYLSTGGGVLGGVGHEPVRQAANGVCEVASRSMAALSPTTEFPTPESGHVRFYVITEKGVFSAESEERSVRNKEHPLHSLYAAGQDLLTALRLSSQKR